jgi:hypothetical protein
MKNGVWSVIVIFEIENALCQENVRIPTTETGSNYPILVPSRCYQGAQSQDMTAMTQCIATWLLIFLSALNTRAIHGFTITIQNGGRIGSPKLFGRIQRPLIHRARLRGLQRDSLDEIKGMNFLALSHLTSRYSVTLNLLWEKRDQLTGVRDELAALESKPGTCNDEKERLQEEQKQIKLQIDAFMTVIGSLQPVSLGAAKRKLEMVQIWQPVLFAVGILIGVCIGTFLGNLLVPLIIG